MNTDKPYEYDVAISFAGEDREYAEALADALKDRDLEVFYDADRKLDLLGTDLLSRLPGIYENQARSCVLLLSKHYPGKHYTMVELKAAQARAAREEGYLIPVRLDDTLVPGVSPNLGYAKSPPETPESIADTILARLGKAPYWQVVSIRSREQDQSVVWNESWRDIFWLGPEAWLCGAIEEGGGGGDVGTGILLHTPDGGRSWTRVDPDRLSHGQGVFTWGPRGTREYEWEDVGPINAIAMYRRVGRPRPEGWLASSTGVFCTIDGGETWHRSTPPPDHPDRYAFFVDLADLEAYSEIYAVGWQGIAHYSARSRRWDLQLPAYFYNISGICALGGSENRSVWAVGRAGIDEHGHAGDRSHGAVYRLDWPANKWEKVPLAGIEFLPGQTLTDVLLLDHETVFATGVGGLALRGARTAGGDWSWTRLPTRTEADLLSIAYADHTLWIVGGGGVILRSPDKGRTWTRSLVKDESGARVDAVLRRVRFFAREGWILGDRIVLRSVHP